MFSVGEDVVVTFDGEECPGEVLDVRNGWILAKVLIDPIADWGRQGRDLPPMAQVMVRERDVRPADE